MKLRRICAGYYDVTQGDLELTIEYRKDLKGWIVSALWDVYLYSDIIPTYKKAKKTAQDIINHVLYADTDE